jgi:hypothetical protein
MKEYLARFLTSRWSISAINGMILIVTIATLYRAAMLLTNLSNDFTEIEDLLDGVGMIFVAYGVALEERDSLMKFFGLYPKYFSPIEESIDRSCHFYGLCLLLMGLFMELTVELVKLPNTVLNTAGAEGAIFGIGFFFCSCAAYLLIKLSMRSIWPEKNPPAEA